MQDATIHNNLGIVCRKLQRYEEALRHCERAVQLDPEAPLYVYTLGLTKDLLQVWAAPLLQARA